MGLLRGIFRDILTVDAKGRGENCLRQFARESSPGNFVALAEVLGSPEVSRIPPGVPGEMKATQRVVFYFSRVAEEFEPPRRFARKSAARRIRRTDLRHYPSQLKMLHY